MQPSEINSDTDVPGFSLAVAAEGLYLLNLLLLPGAAFLILLLLYFLKVDKAPPLAAAHLSQTMNASLWAGVLLILVVGLILLLGGFDGPWTWVVLITYFTICHASLVILGILGLAQAMAGRCWRYPLVGKTLPDGCHALR
ncbi:cytochrome c oxidase subunit III [Solemya velum gill symbiont]|uniref:Cytochrome C oxidase subunit III n=1 Tax=Solemya velum gill symbiont TaxID=2340 RepID=A0A0B0H906_SOVGS|nr:cytochrome c oxidase subunit III [Solemya velum gill symbiont]KHF25152.1 hypothetical protein JV46_05480 [Solemya velum gill symbiont]OOY34873.1 hypothetical protein BOV88_08055 [Solemya velum gill symbiont]OOY37588.1 hypothetical protein BOV89_06890 [Solemya velum gill symbiont]OOY40631.1 hypothetical protein BOV90_03110 [Solemya velum gill symbiont]OOY44253.1 hypothetical protein BOV91_01855 [Solemya velum gill symbiont]